MNTTRRIRLADVSLAFVALVMHASFGLAAMRVHGQVVDVNGRPLSQAMVTLSTPAGEPGPTAVTVFTDDTGHFESPESSPGATITVQSLGFRLVDRISHPGEGGPDITMVMRREANQAGVAPASAWLKDIPADDRETLVQRCVGCHEFPAPEVRAYSNMIYSMPNSDPDETRRQSWRAIAQYMNYLSAWEFGRGGEHGISKDVASNVYSAGDAATTAELLARTVKGPMNVLEGYSYNAPLLVNSRTIIREYEVPRPNAIREALTLDDPGKIWVADVGANRIIRIDAATGAMRDFVVPSARLAGPHTLVRARDGSLWASSMFNGIVSHLDPKTEKWNIFQLSAVKGVPSMHDMTFDENHEVMTDRRGRIWYSDILNNAVGWLDPRTGKSGNVPIPPVPGRVGNESVYGITMASDRTHIWYVQLGIACFGSFNVETSKFETVVHLPDLKSGPRRAAISDGDVLYIGLYGSGQLLAYDTRKQTMVGIYDLPDRASAPYSVTWDQRRKVVWIATSNSNLIYRFDPRDRSFAVLPLPREGAFLRMVAVDKHTGALVTSYANIVDNVRGPRMAVMIDPGDDVGAAAGRPATSRTEGESR